VQQYQSAIDRWLLSEDVESTVAETIRIDADAFLSTSESSIGGYRQPWSLSCFGIDACVKCRPSGGRWWSEPGSKHGSLCSKHGTVAEGKILFEAEE
jgi:hypothetical protein